MHRVRGMSNEPKWWNDTHTSTWDRVKAALKRDWEQTKADVTDGGKELNQDAGDTLKQAAGKQAIPPANVANPADADSSKGDWSRDEAPARYGVGARHQYDADGPDWNDRVESKLKEEWGDLKSGRTWDEVKSAVRRGWDRAKS